MSQSTFSMEIWGVHASVILQIILVVLVLLVSVEQACTINLLLGIFIPLFQHYLSFHWISQPSTPPSQPLSPLELSPDSSPLNISELSLNRVQSQKSSVELGNQNSHTNDFQAQTASLNNPSFQEINLHNNSIRNKESNNLSTSQSHQRIQVADHDSPSSPDEFSRLSHRSLTWSGNKSKFLQSPSFKSRLFQSPKLSARKSVPVLSADTQSIMTYWPIYCFLLFIEQQILPEELHSSHEYQIAKCIVILLLRFSSFSIYLSIKELIIIKDTEKTSLFEDSRRLNENVMRKIDDKISAYSRCGIALARCRSPLQFVQQIPCKSNKTPLRPVCNVHLK